MHCIVKFLEENDVDMLRVRSPSLLHASQRAEIFTKMELSCESVCVNVAVMEMAQIVAAP